MRIYRWLFQKKCIKCKTDYYLSSDQTCKSCHHDVNIGNGYCTVCSDNETDLESAVECNCNIGYALTENKACSFCSKGCLICILGKDKTPICLECSYGKFIKGKECLICPSECKTCLLDDNDQPICTSCYSEYILSNGKCKLCGDGCDNCIFKENGESSCLDCKYNYALNPNQTCTYCGSIDYIGGNKCERCRYNVSYNKYECFQCSSYYPNSYGRNYNYTYIKNKFQCLENDNSNQKYLYGCLEANYIENNKYECLKCIQDFIPIINDKTCRKNYEINLSKNCLEVINIGNVSHPIYTCNKCGNTDALIINLNNISDCFERSNNLVYCSKGKMDDKNNKICTECVSFAHLNKSNEVQICECNSDSFGVRNLLCYKCDDEIKGNPGCVSSEGCEYRIINNQLNCNKCKSNYYEFTKGQCFPCSKEIELCNKCKLGENDQIICEECIDNYIYNKYEKKCELNCEEYSDIVPGCIICNEEYKSKRKCQACKPGYFKTKNESCIYCRDEKYGGPACNKCGKNESNGNIICANCIGKGKALNSKGKCYNCQHELFKECERCKFISTGNNEKIVCSLCQKGFYLDDKGNCIKFVDYLEIIPNCHEYIYQIENLSIYYNSNNDIYYRFYNNETNDYNYFYYSNNYEEKIIDYINSNIKTINYTIKGNCLTCINNNILNSDNKCVSLTTGNCSIFSIIKNNFMEKCEIFCEANRYTLNVLNLSNTNNNISYITISEIYKEYRYSTKILNDLKSLINQTLCIDNSENSKFNYLKNCIIAFYLEKEDKYVCNVCDDGYFLYKEGNRCIKHDDNCCEYENVGNITNPIFSCTKCFFSIFFIYDPYYNYYNNYYKNYRYNNFSYYDDIYNNYYQDCNSHFSLDSILVKEGNVSFCAPSFSFELSNCLSVDVDTTYYDNNYNCTSCLNNHFPHYSKIFDKYICLDINETFQNMNDDLDSDLDTDLDDDDYYKDYDKIEAIKGECPNNTFFTLDGKYCYKCKEMGCKSQCTISLKGINIVKCLDGCQDGYIEKSKGICIKCDLASTGCNKCHYENEYPTNYFGIKRKRKFICDNCSTYYAKIEEKCTRCNYIDNHCEECQIENNEFKCIKCYSEYALDDEGHCNHCNSFTFENKCIKCHDINHGGIEGCNSCKQYKNKTTCSSCEEGYILLIDNGTCLKITENEELKRYNQCKEITLQNSKFECLNCRDNSFSLLKENNEAICIYLPELNGVVDDDYFDKNDLYRYEKNPDIDYIFKYYYNFYIDHYFTFCEEVTNLGTKDKPLYSCTKCNDNKYFLTEERTNISYCIYNNYIENNNDMKNCTEKKIKLFDKKIKFTCAQCEKDYFPVYHEIDKVYYCKKISDTCMVKNCKICKLNDDYFCYTCEFEDYVVNNITGGCMKRAEEVPTITWKDIFRLEMNSVKEINGKKIEGPLLHLKGITNSKISSGHAFLIYLIFKIRQPLRNLEDSKDGGIRIKAICEILNEVEENENQTNSVIYECIGDSNGTDLNNTNFDDIDVGDDNSNLKELKSSKDLSQLEKEPIFLFLMDNNENQTSNDYNFDFKIEGKIDANLSETKIYENLTMNEIKEPSNCIFTIEKDKKANLNCKLNIEKYKNIKLITFNTTQISYENKNNIILVDLNKVYLINKVDNENKSKTGAIIGIIIAAILAIALALIIAYSCIKRKRQLRISNKQKIPKSVEHDKFSKSSLNLNSNK